VEMLNPLRKYRLKLDGSVREHITRSAKRVHSVVMDIESKAVET